MNKTSPPRFEVASQPEKSVGSGAKANPYCNFKSDRERRMALLARDIRLVLMAVIFALGGMAPSGSLVAS